jgi:hypothetical protein
MAVVSIAEAWPASGRPFTVADLYRARQPFPVEVVPSALVAGLRTG